MAGTWHGTANWGSAEIVTRTQWNEQVVDNITWLHDNRFDTTNFNYAPLSAQGTADLTLTGSYQDVPGASVTLNRIGKWLILATFDVSMDSAAGSVFGGLHVAGTLVNNPQVQAYWGNNYRGDMGAVWVYQTNTASAVCKLQAKSALPSAATIYSPHSGLVAFCVKAP